MMKEGRCGWKREKAERALPIINDQNKKAFVKVLASRLDEIEKDTKRKRVEKVIKKLS